MRESVADLMRRCTPAIQSTASVRDTAVTMLREHVDELPIVDITGKLIGVVHSSDLITTQESTIVSITRKARLVVSSRESPSAAVMLMQKTLSDQAIVVDDGKVVGLFTWQDAVKRLAD